MKYPQFWIGPNTILSVTGPITLSTFEQSNE